MPIVSTCPSCGNQGRVPDAARGHQVKCPRCNNTFVVAAAPTSVQPVHAPPVPAVVPPVPNGYRQCPFCAEQVRADARKCRHCGETLDPAMRAAEEAQRAGSQPRPVVLVRDGGDDYREPERSRFGLLGCLLLGGVALALIAGVVFVVQRFNLDEGDKLWNAGKHAEAVEKYKGSFMAASADQKLVILKRIVEHEVETGNVLEARTWIERGLKDKLDVPYNPAAAGLLAQVLQEAADRLAREQAAREAKEREQQATREAKEREKEAAVPKVTAAQLFRAYKENGVAADRDYKGKVIQVTGVVTDIRHDLLNVPYVTLDVGGEALVFEVQCYFSNKQATNLAGLRKGEQVTIRGKCAGKFGNVMVKACTLAP